MIVQEIFIRGGGGTQRTKERDVGGGSSRGWREGSRGSRGGRDYRDGRSRPSSKYNAKNGERMLLMPYLFYY